MSSSSGSGVGSGRSFIGFSQELQGRGEHRYVEPEQAVDKTEVPELVGVGEVLAVPGHQELALVARREGQMQGVVVV
jgi:hypothetical protein